jgi:hypothetical protein
LKYYPDGVPHSKRSNGSFWWRDIASYFDILRGIDHFMLSKLGDSVLLWKVETGEVCRRRKEWCATEVPIVPIGRTYMMGLVVGG